MPSDQGPFHLFECNIMYINLTCELIGIAAQIHVNIAVQLYKLIFQLWQCIVICDAVIVRLARIILRIRKSISGPNYVLFMCI